MSGRILVVDDIDPNRRLLKARLEAEYYDVALACDGAEALASVAAAPPDLILLDVMMPGLDGFEVCRRLKADPHAAHIPVIMVTALDERDDRVRGLGAGADDFLTKPINDVALLARVRSLMRLKEVMDELRLRRLGGHSAAGLVDPVEDSQVGAGARILVVDDPHRGSEKLVRRLALEHRPLLESDPRAAASAAAGPWDLAIVNLAADSFDGLRLAARLRADHASRNLPVLAIVDALSSAVCLRALELGVADVIALPVDLEEVLARVRTLVRRKRYADYLRAAVDQSLAMAVTDQLTGLSNRRALDAQLRERVEEAARTGGGLALLIADIDHFKRINDQLGHDAGDAALKEFARRMKATSRAVDIVCRFGGEEFVILMPKAEIEAAKVVAERLRRAVAGEPFRLGRASRPVAVTVSVGMARYEPGDTAESLLKRADQALYAAKERGRNRVVSARLERGGGAGRGT